MIILAVISINSVLGEDGLIASAERGSIEHTHAMVWEGMEMEYSNYWIDKVMLGGDLITYLQGEDKEIIGKELQGAGYVINVEKLLGTRMSLGNGTDGVNDVYKLEPLPIEEANITKLASTEKNIKVAEESITSESEYQVKYYGPSGDRVLGILGDNISSLIESDNPNFEIDKDVKLKKEYYQVGENIEYVITAKNTGDVTIEDIHIIDTLKTGSGTYRPGDEHLVLSIENSSEGIEAGNGYWIIDSLKSGESAIITYTYTVQEGDIEAGKVENAITELTGVPQPTVPKGHKIPKVDIPVEPKEDKKNISVEKIWKDAYGDIKDAPEGASVTIILYINEEPTDETLTLNEENNWTGVFEGLDIYDETGEKYNYSISEASYQGYTSSYNYVDDTHFEVINNENPPPPPPTITPEYGKLTINKIIEGDCEEAYNTEFTFDVVGPNGYSKTVTIHGEGSVTLNDLTPGTYSVSEDRIYIDGYDLINVTGEGSITILANHNANVTITNAYEPATELPEETPEL